MDAIQALNRAFSTAENRLAAEAASALGRARSLSEKLAEAAHRAAELQASNGALESKLALLRQGVVGRDDELARLRIEITDGDGEMAELQGRLIELEATAVTLGQQLASARQAQAEAAELKALRAAEQARAGTRAEAQAQEVNRLHGALDRALAQVQAGQEAQVRLQAQLEETWRVSSDTAARLAAAQVEVQQAHGERADLRTSLQDLTRDRSDLTRTAAHHEAELARAQQALDSLGQLRDQARHQAEGLAARLDEAHAARPPLLLQISGLQQTLGSAAHQAEAELQAQRQLIEHLQRTLERAQEHSDRHADDALHLSVELKQARSERLNLQASIQQLAEERSHLEQAATEQAVRLTDTQHSMDSLRHQFDETSRQATELTARLDEAHAAKPVLLLQINSLQQTVDDTARQTAAEQQATRHRIEVLKNELQRAQDHGWHHATDSRRLQAELQRLQRSWLWPLVSRSAESPAPASAANAAPPRPAAATLTLYHPDTSPTSQAQAGPIEENRAVSEPCMTMNNTLTNSLNLPAGGDDLKSLLRRHDQDFIESAYRTILRRPADPEGRDFYLGRLRTGEPKLQLLVELSDSPEARLAGPPMHGLAAASRRLRWARLPLIGRLVGTEATADTQVRLRAIEQQIARVARQEVLAIDRVQKAVGENTAQLHALRGPDGMRQHVQNKASTPVFFTICSKNFTAYARTLHESIVQHHPGAAFYMFLCDGLDVRFEIASLPFPVITLSQLDIPDAEGMSQRYNITEFNTAIKPFAFQYLFKIRNAQQVVYVDPDIYVTSPLQEVVDAFRDGADCILTPHILNPAEDAEVSDDKLLLFGIYNLGFIALRNTPRVVQITEWWGRRLEHQCIIALEKGMFVDQKWADLFPAFIPHTMVLRHAGYNVAYWNVPQRAITRQAGVWMANDEPLRFAHFSGNKLDDPTVYSRHSWTLHVGNIGELKALLDIYRDTVYANGHAQYSILPYAYNWNGSSGVNLHTPNPAQEAMAVAAPTEGPAHAVAAPPPMPTEVTNLVRDEAETASGSGTPLPKIFVTDWSTPRPDQDAGSVTTFFLLKILVNLGYDVTFVPSDLEPLGAYTDAVRRLGVRCLHRDDVGTVADFLAREGASFDACILFRAPIAALHLADIRRTAPQAKVVLETVDLHYLRDERAAQADGSEAAIEQARLAKAWELGIIEACDVSIVLSSFEQELLGKELPGADIRTMPLLFLDMPGPSARSFRERANMLFIGGFRHLPNIDAVMWFCKDIWPRVHQRLPDARFQIVGSHPPQEVLDLGQIAGVDVLGHVKDLDPVFGNIRLSVTPLRFGAGIKGKVATSLGYGVPVVGTGLTFEGMELRHDRHVLIADDVDAFVAEVIRGYTDEALWTRLSQDGFERINALYSESAGRTRVEALMDSLALKASDYQFHTFRAQKQYITHRRDHAGEFQRRQRVELDLIERGVDSFFVKGYCAVCACPTDFQVGFMYSYQSTDDGQPIPNWREHLNCMKCGHTTRVRLMVHLIDHYLQPEADARIYVSEQTTPLYRHLQQHHASVAGSEYLGDRVALGGQLDGMRNEDLTQLSFASGSFDLMISCDVLEHVTDDDAAFSECFRCLAPGGRLIFTAPCSMDSARNIIRARVTKSGEIEHLINPPEYHGNPVDPENGALCFRYFGWEILDQLRRAGFHDAYALCTWSRSLGYMGIEQVVFVADKAA